MRDVLPDGVVDAIKGHLRDAARKAEARAWQSAHGDEDTLTGDLCGSLRTEGWQPVDMDGGSWSWKCDYRRVRGRGWHAPEKRIGADVVITIEITDSAGNLAASKALVVQAKIGTRDRPRLNDQVQKMERQAQNSSAVFIYSEGGVRAVRGRDLLAETGVGVDESVPVDLSTFLAESFVECTAGRRGLIYDDRSERMIFARGSQLSSVRLRTDRLVRIKARRPIGRRTRR